MRERNRSDSYIKKTTINPASAGFLFHPRQFSLADSRPCKIACGRLFYCSCLRYWGKKLNARYFSQGVAFAELLGGGKLKGKTKIKRNHRTRIRVRCLFLSIKRSVSARWVTDLDAVRGPVSTAGSWLVSRVRVLDCIIYADYISRPDFNRQARETHFHLTVESDVDADGAIE